MFDGTPSADDQRVRGEGELTADLIVAAKETDEPLTQEQIDSVLGVDRDSGSG